MKWTGVTYLALWLLAGAQGLHEMSHHGDCVNRDGSHIIWLEFNKYRQ